MTSIYAVGVVAHGAGDYARIWRDGSIRTIGQCPPSAYAAEQPGDLPVLLAHSWDKGVVRYLERSHGSLYAVCEVTPDLRSAASLCFSPGFKAISRHYAAGDDSEVQLGVTGARLYHLGMTPTPASINLPPVVFLDRLDEHPHGISERLHAVALRGREAIRSRPFKASWQRSAPLAIADPERDSEIAEVQAVLDSPAVIAGVGRPLARRPHDQDDLYAGRSLRRTFATTVTLS